MSDAQINDKLQIVINKFLCCVPVNDIDLKDYLSSISWIEQTILLNQTINNEIVKRYPIKYSYQRAFLKNVINTLEKNCIELHDNLYDTYCNLLSVDDKEKYFYKHYNVDKRIITLKENKNFISEGTTGLCSWQASLALSQWCLNNKKCLRDKSVLELGSGVGLVGLAAIFNCNPKVFYWSDCHPKVLQILSENIQLNIDEQTQVFSTKHTDKSCGKQTHYVQENCVTENCDRVNCEINETFGVFRCVNGVTDISCGSHQNKKTFRQERNFDYLIRENSSGDNVYPQTDSAIENTILFSSIFENTEIFVVNLPWESVVLENLVYSKIKPDVILAADVVYDNSVFKPLCGAVKYFLDLNKNCEVIFACTERNTDTLQEFLQLLESNELYVNNLASPKPDKFFWSTAIPIRFYKITAK